MCSQVSRRRRSCCELSTQNTQAETITGLSNAGSQIQIQIQIHGQILVGQDGLCLRLCLCACLSAWMCECVWRGPRELAAHLPAGWVGQSVPVSLPEIQKSEYCRCLLSASANYTHLGWRPKLGALLPNVFEPTNFNKVCEKRKQLRRSVHNSDANCWQQLQIDKLINRLIGLQNLL